MFLRGFSRLCMLLQKIFFDILALLSYNSPKGDKNEQNIEILG